MTGNSNQDALINSNWRHEIQQFCEARNWDQYHTPKDLAIGLVTEASEFLELFRFVNDKEQVLKLQDKKFREDVSDEMADVLFFVIRFAQRYNFDLNEALKNKIKKTAQKYPKPD